MIKKIKSILAKIKSKATIKTYQKPLVVTIVSLLVLNLVILIVASMIGVMIDDGTHFDGSFFKAFASSLSWMITPNSITKYDISVDLEIMILAAIVIAIEMIIFSGAIVATLTAALKGFIDKKSQANGKLELENHFVILNWNNKVPDMVYNLLCKHYKENILILSDKNKEYVKTEIDSVISNYSADKKKKKNKINVIVKEGNPLLHGNLKDISIEKASNIVIMVKDDIERGDDEDISNADLLSLKIMLAIGNFNIKEDCNVVVETESYDTKVKIDSISKTISTLKNKSIIPVSFNKKIGQIIAQTVINPLMADIYLELFSYEGVEFYSYKDIDVEEYLKNYNEGIPAIKYNDNLFVLSEDEKYLGIKRTKPINFEKKIIFKEYAPDEDFTVFVVGENKKSKYIVENLKLFEKTNITKFKTLCYKEEEMNKLIEDIKHISGVKKVLLLSDDTASLDSYDSDIFEALIALEMNFPEKENLSFITELLDSRNLNSVKDFNISNAIISNRMMSLLLVQLALNDESKYFYEGLLTVDTEEGGEFFDIEIDRVDQIIDEKSDFEFKTKSELINAFYYGSDKKCMLIGVNRNGKIEYLASGQDKAPYKLENSDELIYIKY